MWRLVLFLLAAWPVSAANLFVHSPLPAGYVTGTISTGRAECGTVFNVSTPVWVTSLSLQGATTATTGFTLRLWNTTSGVLLRQAWIASATNWSTVALDRPIQLTPAKYEVSAVFAGASPSYVVLYKKGTASLASLLPNTSIVTNSTGVGVSILSTFFTLSTANTTNDPLPIDNTNVNRYTFLVDIGFQTTSPFNTTTAATANPVFNAQTLRVGNVTYGPGLCGVTHDCTSASPGVWTSVKGVCRDYNDNSTSVNATSDFTCGLVDPANTCFSDTQCSCTNPCTTGPMCTLLKTTVAATGNNHRVCYQDNPIFKSAAIQPCGLFPGGGCATGTYCRRQQFTGTKTIQVNGVAVVITAGSVCCERGWDGDFCDVPVGCSLHGCDNGGQCVLVNSTRVQDSYCDGCKQGVAANNGTLLSAGFYGQWCHLSKSDGQSWRRVTHVNITNIVGGRRLLSTTVSAPTAVVGSPVYRACECGSGWSVNYTGTLANAPGRPTLLYSGNIGRDPLISPTTSLLAPVGFHPLDTTHIKTLRRTVGSAAEARYLCAILDYACTRVYVFDTTPIYAVFAVNASVPLGVTGVAYANMPVSNGTTVTVYQLDRRARRIRCADDTFDPIFYYNLYQANITAALVGKTVGNLDIPVGTSPIVLAQIHFRMFGHLLHYKPNSGCDFSLDVSEDVLYCNFSIPIEAQVDTVFDFITTRTDTTKTLTTEVCVGNATLWDTTNTTITSRFVTTDATGLVVESTYNTTTSYLTQTDTNVTCATTGLVPPVVTVNTTVAADPIVDLHSIDLTSTCAPVALVNASRFSSALPTPGPTTVNQTGTIAYVQATPVCACSIPFKASSGNQSDCADSLCGSFGTINTTWFESPNLNRIQDACVCASPFITVGDCTSANDCQWCSQTTCITANGGLADPASGGCSCPIIATGSRCETMLCNDTGTFPFNYSYPLGRDTVDSLTGQVLRPENFFCECRGDWHGTYCNVSCLHGSFDTVQQKCICNTRTGFTGDDCSVPLCPGNGQGDWFATTNLTLFNDTTLSDSEVGACQCQLPWTGPGCTEHTCDANPLQFQQNWLGLRPFGSPAKYNTSDSSFVWFCNCSYPYAGTYNGTNLPLDCDSFACGYGSPSSNITATGTAPVDLCQCDTNNQLAIYTNASDCSATACTKPCSVGWCKVDVNVFGAQVIGGPREAPCCQCSAALGYNQNSTCTAYCSFYQPCLTTNTSGFIYNVDTNSYECKCNANYVSASNITNDCSIYVPPPTQVYDQLNPPVDAAIDNSTLIESSSSSTIAGLSKPAFYGLVSTAGFLAILGAASFYTSTTADSITTIKSVASIASNIMPSSSTTGTAGRGKVQERQSLLGKRSLRSTARGLFLLCVIALTSVANAEDAGFSYPDTAKWFSLTAHGFNQNTDEGANLAVGVDVNSIGGPFVGNSANDAAQFQFCIVLGFPPDVTLSPPWRYAVGSPGLAVKYEYSCDILRIGEPTGVTAPQNVKIGDLHYILPKYLSWGQTFNKATLFDAFLSFNLCRFNLTCANGGTCVGLPMTSLSDVTDYYTYNSDIQGLNGFRKGGTGSIVGTTFNGAYDHDVEWNHEWDYNIRGCSCAGTSFFGLHCDLPCPTTVNPAGKSILCSYRGTCASAPMTTGSAASNNEEACLCGGQGCVCDDGFSGKRCEIATPTTHIATQLQISPTTMDFTHCCPWGSNDCAPVQTRALLPPTSTNCGSPGCPAPIEDTASDMTCNPHTYPDCQPGSDSNTYFRRLPVPLVCGEHAVDYYNQTGSGKSQRVNGYKLNDALGTFQDTGRGQCWNNPLQTSTAICWCNTDGLAAPTTVFLDNTLAAPSQNYRLPRRGFWGSNCQKRTCTELTMAYLDWAGATTLPSSGITTIVSTPVTSSVQCSGNWASQLTDGGDDPSQATICDDKLKRDPRNNQPLNLNTAGVCSQCAHGWGGTPGLSTQKLATSLIKANGNGLCHAKTLHSAGGAECGGYGQVTDFRTIWMEVPGYPSATVHSYRQLLSCSCPAGPNAANPWTRPYFSTQYTIAGGNGTQVNTGICQRTCAANYVQTQVVTSFNTTTGRPTTAFSSMVLPQACGGVQRGLCRPIDTGDGLTDSFNSACLCNAPFNGYDCSVNDTRFYDVGFDGASGGVLCGQYGQPVLGPMPAGNTTNFIDYEYFKAFVVPLQGNDLGSTTAYSAYTCGCTVDAPKGYAVDISRGKFTCSRTCASLNNCNGHGTCIDDPYGRTIDKMCRCNRGWGTDDCSVPILKDATGAECGGMTRGVIAYADAFRLTQHCLCLPGYSIHPVHGTCFLDCPQAPSPVSPFALTKCTDSKYGSCAENTVTHNDQVCTCFDGYSGVDCSQTSTASVQGQSLTLYACTGRGTHDPIGGYCVCNSNFVGLACELDVSSRDCGSGTAFRDNAAVGVILQAATTYITPPPANITVPVRHGLFDSIRYLMANPSVADAGQDPFTAWSRNTSQPLWIKTGATGFWNSPAYYAAYTSFVSHNTTQATLQDYIQRGYSAGRDAFVL